MSNEVQDYKYTDEFKTQVAKLREAGEPISAIVKEYGVAISTVSKWHHDYTNSGSFKAADNVSDSSFISEDIRTAWRFLKGL